jgi:PilZ domain
MVLFRMESSSGPESSGERRASIRFLVSVPVTFGWEEGETRTEEGFTKDVSLSGAFVITQCCPPVNKEVTIDMVLQLFDDDRNAVKLRSVGRVIRVVPKAEPETHVHAGFAVACTFSDESLSQLVE